MLGHLNLLIVSITSTLFSSFLFVFFLCKEYTYVHYFFSWLTLILLSSLFIFHLTQDLLCRVWLSNINTIAQWRERCQYGYRIDQNCFQKHSRWKWALLHCSLLGLISKPFTSGLQFSIDLLILFEQKCDVLVIRYTSKSICTVQFSGAVSCRFGIKRFCPW